MSSSNMYGSERSTNALAEKMRQLQQAKQAQEAALSADKTVDENGSKNQCFFQVIPASKREVKFQLLKIESKDIWNRCQKNIFNRRSRNHLSRASVSDLLDDFEITKTNTIIAYGYLRPDGCIEIIAGTRRAFALSLIDDGIFQILVSDDLTLIEQKSLAFTADEYKKPSTTDIAFSIQHLVMNYHGKIDKAGNMTEYASDKMPLPENFLDEICVVLNKSRSFVKAHYSYSFLPKELFDKFVDVTYIGVRFLNEMLKYRQNENQHIVLGMIKPIEFEESDDEDKIIEKTKNKQNEILEQFKKCSAKTQGVLPDNLQRVADAKVIKGVSVKANKTKVTIELKADLFNDPTFEAKLIELIKE